MRAGRPELWVLGGIISLLSVMPGCAVMRRNSLSADLRPCSDSYATTADGWKLGIRRIRPVHPDPGKLPVVLCHGLGLNGTFWTITDDHMPGQLAARGYDVFIVDLRGSGESTRTGPIGWINAGLRQTPLLEMGEDAWNVDDLMRYDVPAVLDHVKEQTGHDRVNWVGHSLGGMLLVPYLELAPDPYRIANFVGMGSTVVLANVPQTEMLKANRQLRVLLQGVSTARLARPMVVTRLPGMDRIDRFYFTKENVDRRTVSRFYGYALEDPGPAALKQLDPYLEFGRMVSADGKTDYVSLLGKITTPTLLIAGEGDIMSDVPSTQIMFDAMSSPDKTLLRFGRRDGHYDDYGHCDLVWSRHAPQEIFPPVIDWLDRRQPGAVGTTPQPVTVPVPESMAATAPCRRSAGGDGASSVELELLARDSRHPQVKSPWTCGLPLRTPGRAGVRARAGGSGGRSRFGKRTENRLPRPGSLRTSTVPPRVVAIRWATARPRPTPERPCVRACGER